jgi:Ca2+-binding EF-hand superfamily protein
MKLFVRNLTEDEIQDLRHAFHTLDVNKTGLISLDGIA